MQTVLPVVTRFFCPSEMPLITSEPTGVSAQIYRDNRRSVHLQQMRTDHYNIYAA